MVEAVELLNRRGGCQLLLAGLFGEAREERYCRSMAGWSYVDYRGWLDRSSVLRLLGEARAGLVVLHPQPGFVDAYPIKMFEYMAASMPVIASDFPLYREILDDGACGLLIPPNDPERLASAIEWIFEHPAEAEAMGMHGRRRIEAHYTWRSEQAKLVALYERLVRPAACPCAS